MKSSPSVEALLYYDVLRSEVLGQLVFDLPGSPKTVLTFYVLSGFLRFYKRLPGRTIQEIVLSEVRSILETLVVHKRIIVSYYLATDLLEYTHLLGKTIVPASQIPQELASRFSPFWTPQERAFFEGFSRYSDIWKKE